MKVGLQIPDFTWPGGAAQIGSTLARIARTADDAGFDSIGVMDHFFQIAMVGPPENEMLEAYSTLGFLAANSSRAKLMTLVTGVHYRHPGLLAKTVADVWKITPLEIIGSKVIPAVADLVPAAA